MGEVYRAHDIRLGRDVAIKVLPDEVASDPKALARFESEARAVAALSHPNILALYDVGEANGVHFAVSELLEGETLRAALRQGAFPVRRALEVSREIAEGLAAAHEKRIVHRDVKPENIFLTKVGHVKLLDFGLARQYAITSDSGFTNSPTADALTGRGVVLGTVAYMSPEQASGRPIDHRSDQFSFGIVLYEMLAGTRPFKGNTVAETLAAIIREEPEPLEKTAPGVPAPLRWIVERLLAKESGGRYESTRDFARDLAALRLHISESTSSRRAALTRTAAAAGVVALAFGAGLLIDRWALPGRHAAGLPNATFQRLTTFDGIETWPSLSPDGKTVAYQKSVNGKSDIYILRVGGKNPTNLTDSLDRDCGEPAFSPDGRFIAFRSESGGGGIFLMEATGESAKRLTDFGHTPAWFPDGKRIVLAAEAGANPSDITTMSELWIVDLDSGARRRIPDVRAYQPSVSPHGLRIAYWGLQPGGGGQRDIFTVGTSDRGAGSITAITSDRALDWSPFWSGDGRFLYFAMGRSLVLERVPAHLRDDLVQPVLARAEDEAHLAVLAHDVFDLHGELRRHDAVEVHDDDPLPGIEERAPLGLSLDDLRDDPVRNRHDPENVEVSDREPEKAVLEAQRLEVAAEGHGNPLLDAHRQAEPPVFGLDEDLPHLGHVPGSLAGDRVQGRGVDRDDEAVPPDRQGRQVGRRGEEGGLGHGFRSYAREPGSQKALS
jgi:serine/threonine protein kinase